ncbi:MAG: fumarylacetoacetate hydrolase family protein [Lentisphaeraceae bacterium]|nr:fumarylacetoacetate hydrolase family protein [Lentisphaeraceae bacterium]
MRIFCIGRNYAAHAAELKNELPTEPVVFIKPESCLVDVGDDIHFPSHGEVLHHEAEIVIEIGKAAKNLSLSDATSVISKIGLGIDLTLRDVQEHLKSKKLPWEKAKAFDYSSPLGVMLEFDGQDLKDLHISCRVNGELRQNGNTAEMIFSVEEIISHLSNIWALQKGDLIYTGTPSGVGPLVRGDKIEVISEQLGQSSWTIC